MAKPKVDIHSGHRQRMRNKLKMHGDRTMETYELLEMLLYNVVVQGDTHPISKCLLHEFGSLEGVFSASKEALMRVDRVGATTADFIIKAGAFISLMDGSDISYGKICFDDFAKAGEYVVKMLADTKGSSVIMLLLDSKLNLISGKEIYQKRFSSAGVRANEFLNYAIEKRASVAITAHTEPGCAPFPLVGDRETCKMIDAALADAGVLHLEHFVVANNRFTGTKDLKKYGFAQSVELTRFFESKERYNAGK